MKKLIGITVGAFFFAFIVAAQAADTYETYDQGAVDFEFYAGGDGLNLDKYEKTVFSDFVLGYGLIDGLSGYLSFGTESDEYMVEGEGSISSGIFGTPLDTDYVDLDLILDVSLSGPGLTQQTVAPGFEINLDLKPDLELLGVYARIMEEVTGRDESTPDDPNTPEDEYEMKREINVATNQTYGLYFTVAEGHQILAEYYQISNSNPGQDELELDLDGIALGYNVMLTDNLELINQVNFHPEHDDQDFYWGASTGILVTLAPPEKEPAK